MLRDAKVKIPGRFLSRLRRILPKGSLLVDSADRWSYGYDNSRHHASPDVVAFPVDVQQVQACVRLCDEFNVPIVARGRGTGTTGASVPVRGGLVLSMERMARILVMDPANRVMVVEPGVTNQEVQDAAAVHGFFWPPDPSSATFCTVGGNLACNSAGPHAIKYGTTRENTLGLQVVIGTGDIVHTGVYTTKGVVGYDLTRLIIGSEGTLAVITEAILKLTPLPESRRILRAVYADMESTAAAVIRVMTQAVTPCALEMIDGQAIEMIRSYSRVVLPRSAGGLLMIEVDGPGAGLDEATARIMAAARGAGLLELNSAATKDEADALWAARKALSPALRTVAPKKINEDVVVPISCMAELIAGLRRLGAEHGITIVNFGHAGNGNIHVNLMVDPDNPAQMIEAERCLDKVFDLVLNLGGTLSGEHGVGILKRNFINREIDPLTLNLMRKIKATFDPHGILNPDKIFP
ncbi:glycolate oxidase [Gammaproteobacteria bacterium]